MAPLPPRLLPLLVAVVVAVAIAACQNQTPKTVSQAEPGAPSPIALPAATPAPAPSQTPFVAQLNPVSTSPSGIQIPRVAGLNRAVAARINAVFDRKREEAVDGAEACRLLADDRAVEYSLVARETYNRKDLLSLRLDGYAFCGGANGSHLGSAYTFDLRTGAAIDVLSLTGLDRSTLGRLGRDRYDGEAACKAFLAKHLDRDASVEVADAYLDTAGIGIRYVFNVGAAESCTRANAVVPLEQIRRDVALKSPLDRM